MYGERLILPEVGSAVLPGVGWSFVSGWPGWVPSLRSGPGWDKLERLPRNEKLKGFW